MSLTVIRQANVNKDRFLICAYTGRYWYVQEYARSPLSDDGRLLLLRTHGGEWTTEEGALFEYNKVLGDMNED